MKNHLTKKRHSVLTNVKENRTKPPLPTLQANPKEQRWLKKDVFSISERGGGRETMQRLFIYTQESIMLVDVDAYLRLLHSQDL